MYENRQYIIFSVSELDKIDFNEVLETSSETLRLSVDQSKTFVKWNGDTPSFISNLTTKSKIYNHEEILEVLSTPAWTTPMDEELQQ